MPEQYEMMNSDLTIMHTGDMQKDFRRMALWDWVERQLQSGLVVDAGGGSGFMSVKALMAGHPVLLIEPDPELRNFARERIKGLGLETSFSTLDSPIETLEPERVLAIGEPIQNILCMDVLEHIENDQAALASMVDLLEPGGRLIVSVPAGPYLYGQRDVDYGHYRRYTRPSLDALLNSAPMLDVKSICYWNLIGIPPYFLYEKVIKKPINDSLRQSDGNALTRIVRGGLMNWLRLETRISPPRGLSLLAMGIKK